MRDLRHLFEFTFIGLYFGILIYFFSYFTFSEAHKFLFSISLPLFYFLWGVIHHFFEDRLTREVFFEYLSISIFIFIILFTASSL